MKNMKKIGALVLALVMVLALSATAFAAEDMAGEGGVIGDFTTPDTPTNQEKAIKLYKEITAYNPDGSTVNAPTITYTYTVTPGSADKEIYDVKTAHDPQANAHAYTKAGITTGVTVNGGSAGTATSASGTVAWTPADQLGTSADGHKNVKPIEIDFTNVAFTRAGVYRYEIAETVASYTSSGVVNGAIADTRYLDVYVKDGSTAGSYDIYGYVCFTTENPMIDARDGASTNTVTAAGKTEGFVSDVSPDSSTGDYSSSNPSAADKYYTFDLTITKNLVGDQAMNSHKFPFSLAFANTTVTGNVLPIVTGSGTESHPTSLTAGAITSFAEDGTNLKIANGGSVTYTGIPVGTTVTINEKNDVTSTVYTVSTSGGTTNQTSGLAVNSDTWTNTVTGWTTVTALQKDANDNAVKADNNMTVTFTNTLLTISPTGYVVRIAPYALMLAAGIVLFLLMRRRRQEAEEA